MFGEFPGSYDGYDYDYYDDDSSSEEDEYGCWWKGDPRFEGYSRHEIEEEVTFWRPEYNEETDEFDREGKDVGWCLSNGFEEVGEGEWSGPWYWRRRGGEEARRAQIASNRGRREKARRERAERKRSQTKHVDEDTFLQILQAKRRGNDMFRKGNYERALEIYGRTHDMDRHFHLGLFLAGEQRAEKVNILSNEAECYLRLRKYTQAEMKATDALTLDKRHEKSLVRRAKATYHGKYIKSGDMVESTLLAGVAKEDLEKVIRMGGSGAEDAQKLLDDINLAVEKELERFQPMGFGGNLGQQQR